MRELPRYTDTGKIQRYARLTLLPLHDLNIRTQVSRVRNARLVLLQMMEAKRRMG